jgi:hypothetical protein
VEMLQRVMGDVPKRLAESLERNCGHLNDVFSGSRILVFKVLTVKNQNSFMYTLCLYVFKLHY